MGAGRPLKVMAATRPNVLRQTVFPPALPPVIINAFSPGRNKISMGCTGASEEAFQSEDLFLFLDSSRRGCRA